MYEIRREESFLNINVEPTFMHVDKMYREYTPRGPPRNSHGRGVTSENHHDRQESIAEGMNFGNISEVLEVFGREPFINVKPTSVVSGRDNESRWQTKLNC